MHGDSHFVASYLNIDMDVERFALRYVPSVFHLSLFAGAIITQSSNLPPRLQKKSDLPRDHPVSHQNLQSWLIELGGMKYGCVCRLDIRWSTGNLGSICLMLRESWHVWIFVDSRLTVPGELIQWIEKCPTSFWYNDWLLAWERE